MATPASPPLTPFESALLRKDGEFMVMYVPTLMAQTGTWGMYVLVISFSVYILCKQGIRNSRPRAAMLILSWLMFLVATAILSLSALLMFIQVKAIHLADTKPGQSAFAKGMTVFELVEKLSTLKRGLFAIEVLLGDAVVLWRTWVLWGDHRWVMVFPIAFYLGTAGSRIAISIRDARTMDASTQTLKYELPSIILSVVTNSICTAMIAFKAWQYRSVIKEALGPAAVSTKVNHVLSLLVESGIVYVIIFAVQAIGLSPLAIRDDYHPVAIAALVMDGVIGQLIGIYPTLIIILVGLQRTVWDSPEMSGQLTSLRFAPRARAPSETDTEQGSVLPMEFAPRTTPLELIRNRPTSENGEKALDVKA